MNLRGLRPEKVTGDTDGCARPTPLVVTYLRQSAVSLTARDDPYQQHIVNEGMSTFYAESCVQLLLTAFWTGDACPVDFTQGQTSKAGRAVMVWNNNNNNNNNNSNNNNKVSHKRQRSQ